MKKWKRSHTCGKLTKADAGKEVTLLGWVDTRRDHGGLIFVDLRDRYGKTQIVFNPVDAKQSTSKDFRSEYVVAVTGKVRARPEGMANSKMSTGDIELEATECEVLSVAKTTPFQLGDDNVSEVLRLKYRYLDLRRDEMHKNLQLRHDLITGLRAALNADDFLEIETPILYKSTPEGARDYLVPSRVHPGSFYALPQSPQTLKQMLMIAGYDKYYQVARCFRDEDLRAERQPEFTQLDIEMSFVDMEEVMEMNEKLVSAVWKKLRGYDIGKIPVMTYDEAMNSYGNDKPDLRFGLKFNDLTESLKNSGFKVFDDVSSRGGAIKGFAIPGAANMSRGQIDKYTDLVKRSGAKGLVWIKWEADKVTSAVAKFFSEDKLKEMITACGGKQGDAVFLVADDWNVTCSSLAGLRLQVGADLNLIDKSKDKFLWVIDFPLFDYSPEDKRWVATHHPFTMMKEEHADILITGREEDYGKIRAKAYDLVCNGYEIAGGSIRIFRNEVQSAMFKALRISPEEAEMKFGYFLEALNYGTPPHGGIAWGLDRVAMILCNTEAIRDVIAFPKTSKATCMMSEAPTPVDRSQLLELGLSLLRPNEK
jgi:aspartyl-tRNA synthetase